MNKKNLFTITAVKQTATTALITVTTRPNSNVSRIDIMNSHTKQLDKLQEQLNGVKDQILKFESDLQDDSFLETVVDEINTKGLDLIMLLRDKIRLTQEITKLRDMPSAYRKTTVKKYSKILTIGELYTRGDLDISIVTFATNKKWEYKSEVKEESIALICRPGQHVWAKWKDNNMLYFATVSHVNNDGTYVLEFEDGDIDYHASIDDIHEICE